LKIVTLLVVVAKQPMTGVCLAVGGPM